MTATQQQDYEEVRTEAAEVLDDPDLWLETPHALLAGKKPRSLVESGDKGKQVVLDLLGAIRTGAFT